MGACMVCACMKESEQEGAVCGGMSPTVSLVHITPAMWQCDDHGLHVPVGWRNLV